LSILRWNRTSKTSPSNDFYFVSQQNGPMSDVECLELFEKLEKAEGRILALEKQVR